MNCQTTDTLSITSTARNCKTRRPPQRYRTVPARVDSGLKRSSRRARKFKKMKPCWKLKNLDDLIRMSNTGDHFTRIDNVALRRIRVHLEKLNKLVGLTHLKQSVFDQVLYYLQRLNSQSDDFLHTVLIGPPGVGKTTVAKILADIYSGLKLFPGNGGSATDTFKIAHRDDFVSGYLGQTAIKTSKLLKSCLGKVLFIDEVYSMGSGSKKDSFAKEAVDTLCSFLSEHASEFVCIIAGYEDEVDRCFFKSNPGLKSRFQWSHKLSTYSPDEMMNIFANIVEDKGWTLDMDSDELKTLFVDNAHLFEDGQARSLHSLFFKTKIHHSSNILSNPSRKRKNINMRDIKDAIVAIYDADNETEERTVSLYMYM